MTDTPDADGSTAALTTQHAELLRDVHTHVSAAAAMIDVARHTAWPADIEAEHGALLGRLVAARKLAEGRARTAGIPDRMITMAWLAGYRRQPWPATEPAVLGTALRELTRVTLESDVDRLQDMADLHLARAHHLGLIDGASDPDPAGAEQYQRNGTALQRRVAALAELLDLTQDQWESLSSRLDETQVRHSIRYMNPDAAEMVRLRWTVYANPAIEITAHLTAQAIRTLPGDPEPRPQQTPDPGRAAHATSDPTVTATPDGDGCQQSSTDTVLPPGSDRSWHADTDPAHGTATDPTAPDSPGPDPW